MAKSERILPAISAIFTKPDTQKPPVSYMSPNLLELARLYQMASSEPLELTSHPKWWDMIDSMSLGSSFRMDLERLARQFINELSPNAGTLDFILERGVAQMAVNLLPFFQHIFLKCGSRGLLAVFQIPPGSSGSLWRQEQSNMKQRQAVAHGKNGSVVVIKHYPAVAIAQDELLNVTGAGDSLVGSILASLVQNPKIFDESPVALDKLVAQAQTVSLTHRNPHITCLTGSMYHYKAAIMTLKSMYAVSPELSKLSLH